MQNVAKHLYSQRFKAIDSINFSQGECQWPSAAWGLEPLGFEWALCSETWPRRFNSHWLETSILNKTLLVVCLRCVGRHTHTRVCHMLRSEDNFECWSSPSKWFETGSLALCRILLISWLLSIFWDSLVSTSNLFIRSCWGLQYVCYWVLGTRKQVIMLAQQSFPPTEPAP